MPVMVLHAVRFDKHVMYSKPMKVSSRTRRSNRQLSSVTALHKSPVQHEELHTRPYETTSLYTHQIEEQRHT